MGRFDRYHGQEPIVAVGLLTQHDLDLLGNGFRRAFLIDDTPCFEELLSAIDAAEQQVQRPPQG